MKNLIILLLAILCVFMATIYLFHRQKKIKETASRMEKIRSLRRRVKPFRYEVSIGDSIDKGYILFAPYQGNPFYNFGSIIIMDMAGRIIRQKLLSRAVYDFRQWHIGNRIYYSYITDDSTAFHFKGVYQADGHVVILDSALNMVKELHLLPFNDIDRRKKIDLDVHDFIMLSENHFITFSDFEKHVSNIPAILHPASNIKVGACIIQEIVNENVVWQWDATSYPEFYLTSTFRNDFRDTRKTQDYAHFNAAILDPKDSNLIVSFKGLNQVIKIDRKSGAIMWWLGGRNSDFPLTENQVFMGQHGVILSDSNTTLLMLDNGNDKKRFYSRILEFRLDEKKKKINYFSAYKIPHKFSSTQGNVTKVGNNYLICGGAAKYILLVDPKTDKYIFEMRVNLMSYRAYKVDSLYGLEKKSVNQN